MRSFQYFVVASQALFLAASAAESSSKEGTRTGTTVSYYIPGFDPQQFVGSVVAADATATTLKIQCPTDAGGSKCGLSGNAEVTKKLPTETSGKTTFDGAYTHATAPVTTSWHCRLREASSAKCDMTKISLGITAIESGKAEEKGTYQTISVTGGMKKLREAAASGGSDTATSNSAGGKAAATGSSTSNSTTGSSSKSNAKPTSGAARGALVAGLMGVAAIAI